MFLFSITLTEKNIIKTQLADLLLENLIARVSQGDEKAFEELYTNTKTAVYGFALSILKRTYDAEDTMQDTYIKIYKSSSGYIPQGKPMAWILTITRNLSLMKLREYKNKAVPMEFEPYTADQDDFTASSEDRIILNKAFAILSETERQIVILHSVSGLKHKEIAEILEIPLSTALSKYNRALKKLKKKLEEE